MLAKSARHRLDMCRTVPISVAVSAAPEGTLWRCGGIVPHAPDLF